MAYVVNVDTSDSSALVHEADCPDYETYKDVKDPRNGAWYGPFDTQDEALAFAECKQRNARPAKCRKCRIAQ